MPSAIPAPFRLTTYLLYAFAAAQQQQQPQNGQPLRGYGSSSSPHENAALIKSLTPLDSVKTSEGQPSSSSPKPPPSASIELDGSDYVRRKSTIHQHQNQNQNHQNPKPSSKNERAVATLAPVALDASVRAPVPVKSAAGPERGLSQRPRARSLQDWEVENFVLLATVDGSIYARDRNTGKELWKFYSERPMVETIYHHDHQQSGRHQSQSKDSDFMWIIEPNQDGSLYIFVPGPGAGLQKLGLTVKELAELSPYASEESPFVYTAEKKNSLFTLNATNGAAIKFFSSGASGVMDNRSCRSVHGFRMEEDDGDECDPTPTIHLGRTEYTVGIQDRDTGEGVCTIKYFEWTANNRDRDLQNQYSATMDNKYIYSRFDGGIIAVEHGQDQSQNADRFLYRKKFSSSPVVRVFDVARQQGIDSRDTPLVVLPQPIAPVVNDEHTENIFINCTEAGSWYALSESSYPSVTDGAAEAKCYQQTSRLDDFAFNNNDDTDPSTDKPLGLVGVHSLMDISRRRHDVPTIGGPSELLPVDHIIDENDTAINAPVLLDPRKSTVSSWFANQSESGRWSWLVILMLGVLLARLNPELLSSLKPRSSFNEKMLISSAREMVSPSQPSPRADVENDEVDNNNTRVIDNNGALVTESSPTTLQPVPDTSSQIRPENPQELSGETAITAGGTTTITAVQGSEALPDLTPQVSAEVDSTKQDQLPKKKKTHRGQRGGRKKRKDKKAEADADDEVVRVVEEIIKVDDTMKPDEDNPIEGRITDVSGSIQLNNLIVHSDVVLGYGSGGTVVYEGSFEGREVAVKRMLLQYFDLASQEVSLLQQSDDHANVIRYFCHQKDRNFLYIAVERCQASLWDLYREGGAIDGLNAEQLNLLTNINCNVPAALYQLASGLSHLHGLRIIHRDIKPQNILIAYPKKNHKGGPRFVISDFGLCRTLPDNASTLVGTVGNAGTIGWKAPELIGQTRDGDGRTTSSNDNGSSSSNDGTSQGVKRAVDIFSLGCVFFYVLTNGAHPFDKEEPEVWHVERELNIKKGLSNFSKLRNMATDAEEPMHLIEWMLSPKPEQRPTALDVMHHPFFWSPVKRLNFLCDVSDHWEREVRDPPSPDLQTLESFGPRVHSNDFLKRLDKKFIDTLGKQRKYTTDRMLDLLRALRNKKNHYADMPEDVQKRVGDLPDGYLGYWTSRFPSLLMACFEAVRACGLEGDPRFRPYMEEGQN